MTSDGADVGVKDVAIWAGGALTVRRGCEFVTKIRDLSTAEWDDGGHHPGNTCTSSTVR